MSVLNALTDSSLMLIMLANRSVLTVDKLILMDFVLLVMMDTELRMEFVSDLMMKEISSVPNGITMSVLPVLLELTLTIMENVSQNPLLARTLTMKAKSVSDVIKDINSTQTMFVFWPHQKISIQTAIGLKIMFVSNALRVLISTITMSVNNSVPTVRKPIHLETVSIVMMDIDSKMEPVSDSMTKEISSAPSGITTFVFLVPSELTSTTTENASPSQINAKISTTNTMSALDAIKDMSLTLIMFAFWPHQEISTPTVIGLKTTFVLNALKDPISMTITSANKLVPTVKKLIALETALIAMMDID